MYRIMQSFKPGETTQEIANQIGYDLAMEFSKGQHQFVVYTYEDNTRLHNHIEINSTNLECDGKFENVKGSVKLLREMNDKIYQAHGLSVPVPKRKKLKSRGEMGTIMYGKSFKEQLRQLIDAALPGCMDFEEFLVRMRTEGYEIKRGGGGKIAGMSRLWTDSLYPFLSLGRQVYRSGTAGTAVRFPWEENSGKGCPSLCW